MNTRHTALGALAGMIAAAVIATPAPAAKPSCSDMQFNDRTRVTINGNANVAGVVFRPKGDRFHIWDNDRDGHAVWIEYNYSGIDDKWKSVPTISDGAQGEVRHNLAEGKQICFRIQTDNPDYPDSPIVRYKTS